MKDIPFAEKIFLLTIIWRVSSWSWVKILFPWMESEVRLEPLKEN